MTGLLRSALAAAMAIAPVTLAHAALRISHHPTQNVTCSAGVCSATAADAVLNIDQLTGLLASGSATVASTSAAGDIVVSREFSWASANTLTLDAFHSVIFKKSIVVAGPGGLTIKTNDGGSGGDLLFKRGHVEFWDLTSALVIDGQSYTLVGTLAQLAADIGADPSGRYALAKNYHAGDDGTYAAALIPTPLTGTFEGLGNAIKRLTIDDPDASHDVGLFLELGAGGVIRDVTLPIANIHTDATSGRSAGVLVARNFGSLLHVKASGVLFGQLATYAGGLAGFSGQGAQIRDATSLVRVTFPGKAATHIGGLVGFNDGTITDSNARQDAIGGQGSDTGGLVGQNSVHGSVTDSFAFGSSETVFTGNAAGGLVGVNDNLILNCYATNGPVVDAANNGGLVGINNGTIMKSHATGNGTVNEHHGVSGGGLVGSNAGIVSESYSTGHFDGTGPIALGGLVGINTGSIENSYSEGGAIGSAVKTTDGGFVGVNFGTLSTSYSIGFVGGPPSRSGGSIGVDNNPGGASAIYWDTDSSTITDPTQGAGKPRNDPGLTPLTTTQLQSGLPAGFSASVWGQNASINFGLPYLLALPPRQH